MTHSICEDAKENDTAQLIDKRANADGTYPKYWIAKLADGNCWMTQNLDLDIPASGLTATLSDMTTNWNSSTNSTYPPVATQTGATPNFSTTTNAVQSWNPGLKVYDAANGGNTPVGDYDAHYAVGNYYSWGAATAGQAGSLTSSTAGEPASQSICPKNWALPGNGAYLALFSSYGPYQSKTLLYGDQSILNGPLYFVRGGTVPNSSLLNAGSYGYYWSSTASSASNAYFLIFSTNVDPSSPLARYYGASVRCVAR